MGLDEERDRSCIGGGENPTDIQSQCQSGLPPFLALINCQCFETLANTCAVNKPGKGFEPVLQIATGFSTLRG